MGGSTGRLFLSHMSIRSPWPGHTKFLWLWNFIIKNSYWEFAFVLIPKRLSVGTCVKQAGTREYKCVVKLRVQCVPAGRTEWKDRHSMNKYSSTDSPVFQLCNYIQSSGWLWPHIKLSRCRLQPPASSVQIHLMTVTSNPICLWLPLCFIVCNETKPSENWTF